MRTDTNRKKKNIFDLLVLWKKDNDDLRKAITSLERKVAKLTDDLAKMEKEKNKNWKLYKKANDERAEKLPSHELVKILLVRLFNIMKGGLIPLKKEKEA